MLSKPKYWKPQTKLIYEFWAFKAERYALKLIYKVREGKNCKGKNIGSLKSISVERKIYCLLYQFTEKKFKEYVTRKQKQTMILQGVRRIFMYFSN